MNHLDFFIRDMAIITITCILVTILFKKIKLPVVLGYIVAGFLISPHFIYIPTVVEVDNINTWANIGIVFLLFALGLEFSFKKIADVGINAIVTAITVMGSMIVIGTITGRLLGFDRMDSIFLGGMLSISSTMIIMKAYEEYNLKKEGFAKLVMGTMVVEDVGGIFMMIILSTMALGKNVSGLDTALELGKLIVFLLIWLVLGIFLIPSILRAVSKFLNDELLLIFALAVCFGMVVVSYLIGFSEALGAFMGGSILAGTVKGEQIDKLIKPLKDLFGAIFFVSVGMMVVPEMLVKYIVPILIITVVTIFGQSIFATLGIIFAGRSLRTAIRGGFSMVQIGEFSFIIAAMGTNLGVTGDFLYPVIVCVSVITIFTTPLFIKNSEKAYNKITKILPYRLKAFLRRYTSETTETKDTQNDWKRFLKRYMTRTIICASSMFAIFKFSTNYVDPFLDRFIEGHAETAIMVVSTCILMLIPTSIMAHKKNNIFIKLWIKSNANRLPLTLLRGAQGAISAMFFTLIFRYYLRLSWTILILIAVVIVFVIIRSDFLKGHAIRIEARFIANINEKVLQKRKEEANDHKWLGDRLYVAEFILGKLEKKHIIKEFYDRKVFEMRVIKIIRKGIPINMPDGEEELYEGDTIQLIGTKDKLEGYLLSLEKKGNVTIPEQPIVSVKDYLYGQIFKEVKPEDQIMYVAVPVTKDTNFAKKTVKACGFREKYNGFIIGIERNNFPIVDPKIDTYIHNGDIIWAVGTEKMAEKLLKDELIE